jgi:ribonuclease HIII
MFKVGCFLSSQDNNKTMDLHNILIPLYEADVKKLRTTLKRRRYEFAERAHAHFTAKKGRLHVTVYENGPKALVQGNAAREFARDVLESMVMGG